MLVVFETAVDAAETEEVRKTKSEASVAERVGEA